MHTLQVVLQIVVALGLLNVWLLRSQQSTAYRGGSARSMKEEFAYYKLPPWSMYVVGGLKVVIAICLIAGIWFQRLIVPALIVLVVLMVGALVMHVKVRDPLKKALPALGVLVLSVAIYVLSVRG